MQSPSDKLCLGFTKNIDPADICQLSPTGQVPMSKETMNQAYLSIVESIKQKQAKLCREFMRSCDKKACITGQKYEKDEASD